MPDVPTPSQRRIIRRERANTLVIPPGHVTLTWLRCAEPCGKLHALDGCRSDSVCPRCKQRIFDHLENAW